MESKYTSPQFQFVRNEEQNKVFYAASNGPDPTAPSGTLSSMTVSQGGWN